jgi:hypothetical protein
LLVFGVAPARAQYKTYAEDTPFVRRWSLSFNPLGLLEDPAAIGIGVGYAISRRVEIWSETSSLFQWAPIYPTRNLSGFRQIIRLSLVPPKVLNLGTHTFLAVELRYKTYSYRDSGVFLDPASGDTLTAVPFQSKHFIFGAALQAGYRFPLWGSARWQGEVTIGLGVKYKKITHQGPLPRYQYQRGEWWSTDVSIPDMIQTAGWEPYLPGSFRIFYTFGRRLR